MTNCTIICGDALTELRKLPAESVQCCVTSPPYWGLRDYGVAGQLGLEATPQEYVAKLVEIFREVRRVLREDGVLWLNLGDSYNGSSIGPGKIPTSEAREATRSNALTGGHIPPQGSAPKVSTLKPKDLVGIPWRVAFALQADGWWLRQDIIWSKPNPMPESVTDRCTKAHEYVFLLTKAERYFYDAEAVREPAQDRPQPDPSDKIIRPNDTAWHDNRYAPGASGYGHNPAGRNKRSVWTIPTAPYPEAHFATFPPKLVEPMILAGSKPGDTILDPFGGSGTTGEVAQELGRNAILIELNPAYCDLIRNRTAQTGMVLT